MPAKKFLAFVLALTLALALFTGCSKKPTAGDEKPSDTGSSAVDGGAEQSDTSEAPPEEVSKEPIKIGHIVDLTGTQAMTGMEAERALDFALKAMGGEIAGHPVEIIVGDAQDTTTGAVDVARRMVEVEGVAAIFGPTQPGQKSAVAEYAKEVGIPVIFYNASPTYLLEGNDWVVGAGGATPQLPTVMADYVYNTLGYTTVNTLSMDNVGFRSFIEPFVENYEALGGTVVHQAWAPIGCSDWAPYLISLKEADAIIAWASGSDAISLWKYWYDMGFSERMPMIAPHHGGFTDYFVPKAIAASGSKAADAMLGALSPMLYVYDIDTPENKAFIDLWKAEFGSVPSNNLPGSCYQAFLLFKTAMESINGDTDPDKLIEAIFNADVTGPEGHLFFDGSHAATKDVYITKVIQMEDGSYNNAVVTVYEDVPPTGLVVE
ncbi:MAG: ABC transporter substrate-binding protein [Oscillospiraceae bacterium]